MANWRAASFRKLALISGALLLAGVLTRVGVFRVPRATDKPRDHVKVHRAAATLLVSNAVLAARQAVEKNSESFGRFVLSRKAGARAFAEDSTSLYGKWRAVKPYLPWADSNGHKQYIQAAFERRVMSRGDLGSALKVSIEGAVRDVEGIQNELAVELRQEIAGCHLGSHEIPVAQREFRDSIHKLVGASQRETASAAGNLAVNEAASFVAGRVVTRLAIQAGVLAAGAADSWWTLGASLVVGLVVDMTWGWIDNPVDKIVAEVDQSLDKVARDSKAALLAEMAKLVDEKRKLWEAATANLVENLEQAK